MARPAANPPSTAGPRPSPQDHTCPVCQGTFTANPRIRQVYCSPGCRHRAAKQRDDQRSEQRAARVGETPPARPELPALPKAVTRPGRQLSAERDPLEPTVTRGCPHCRQPVTIVALLATPEAARPAMPAGPDVIPLRRTP
jgi:hypothetical protein